MCTKSIAFAKALAHTCLQISRVLCGEIKNFKPNKNKNVSNEKQALSQGLLFLLGAKFSKTYGRVKGTASAALWARAFMRGTPVRARQLTVT